MLSIYRRTTVQCTSHSRLTPLNILDLQNIVFSHNKYVLYAKKIWWMTVLDFSAIMNVVVCRFSARLATRAAELGAQPSGAVRAQHTHITDSPHCQSRLRQPRTCCQRLQPDTSRPVRWSFRPNVSARHSRTFSYMYRTPCTFSRVAAPLKFINSAKFVSSFSFLLFLRTCMFNSIPYR